MPPKQPSARPRPSFRNRVVDVRQVHPAEIVPNDKNPRIHTPTQTRLLTSLMSEIGFVGAFLTYTGEDGRLYLIDGHERQRLLASKDGTITALVTDLSPEEADAVLLSYDQIGGLAELDDTKLDDLLESLTVGRPAIEAMLDALQDVDIDFKPLTDPTAATPLVDEEAMARARAALDASIANDKSQMPVTCPNCGTEYFVDTD